MANLLDKHQAAEVRRVSTEGKERFTAIDGIVRENSGEIGALVVTPNPEHKDKGRYILNVESTQEQLAIISESKKKRVDTGIIDADNGPMFMQTDGPEKSIADNINIESSSKSLQGAGSGIQARQEL